MVRNRRAKLDARSLATQTGITHPEARRAVSVPCGSASCRNLTRDPSGLCHHHRHGPSDVVQGPSQLAVLVGPPPSAVGGSSTSSPMAYVTSEQVSPGDCIGEEGDELMMVTSQMVRGSTGPSWKVELHPSGEETVMSMSWEDADQGVAVRTDTETHWYRSLTDEERASYDAYERSAEEQYQRSQARRGAVAPMKTGTKLDAEHYFCASCWQQGDETGAHPYAMDVCDPPVRNW